LSLPRRRGALNGNQAQQEEAMYRAPPGRSKPLLRVASLLSPALFASTVLAPAPAAAGTMAPAVSCASLTALSLPNTQILSATAVPAAGALPAYCNVVGVINKRVSTQDPDHFTYGIGFQLNLPDQWIGRFEMQGGGGTDGSVRNPIGSAGTELSQGWAVAADDGGHEDVATPPFGWSDDDSNAGGSAHFGIDAQARRDYGYTGIEQTASIAKQIIRHYYGQEPDYSYLWGCSNGGRDGMVSSQRFPETFDGIVSGNPGFDLPRAGIGEAWNEQVLAPLATRVDVNGQPYIPDTFPPQDLQVVSAAVLSACDGLDGLVDGIVDNFPACTNKQVYPALDAFTCSPTGAHGNTPHGGTCLTADQVAALKKLYAGAKNSKGKAVYSGWFWDGGIGTNGWSVWNVGRIQTSGPLSNSALNLTLGAGAVPMVFTTPPVVTPVTGPTGQEAFIFHYNFDTDAPKIYTKTRDYPESAMEFMTGVSPDLHRFQGHGGKLIIYSSVNDGIFSGVDIVDYYERMNEVMGGRAQSFARLFMIPNMGHCGGGPATTSFSASMLTAITNWVENGVAPDRIVAANTSTTSPFPSGGIFDPRVAQNFPTGGTRPLCPYPQQARYKGAGATNDAQNFVCVTPHGGRGHHHDDDHGFFGYGFDAHDAAGRAGDRD
jgi:hypothetical protein